MKTDGNDSAIMSHEQTTRFIGKDGKETGLYTPNAFGLTKRELFAGMALQGLCAKYGTQDNGYMAHMADQSVKFSDALIEALNKEQ